MSFISNLKNKETDSLLIELGTDSVRVVLFSVKKERNQTKEVILKGESGKQLEVPSGFLNPLLSKMNTKMSFSSGSEDVLPISIFKETIRQAIFEAMPARISQNYNKGSLEDLLSIVDKVTIVLSPALAKPRVDDLVFERKENDLPINGNEETEIHSWLKSEMNKKAEEYSSKIGLLPEEIIPIDLKIEEIKIDGYYVNHLTGYGGKTVEFKTVSAMVFAHYLAEIKSIFENRRINSKNTIRITHSAAALGPLIEQKKIKGILMDIQERWTQIFIVDNGIITSIVDINCGNRCFCRAIEDRLGLSENEAVRLEEEYVERRLSESARERIHIIIAETADRWFAKINQQIAITSGIENNSEITNKLFFNNILLFGQGAKLTELKAVIENNWQKLLVSAPSVIVIDPQIITSWLIDIGSQTRYKDLTGRVSSVEDVKTLFGILYDLS
ncbi:MAG: hypothetical protein V1905_01040 [bacterium]